MKRETHDRREKITFEVGDVVLLASDLGEEQRMTIEAADPATFYVSCIWFDGEGHLQRASIPPAALVAADIE